MHLTKLGKNTANDTDDSETLLSSHDLKGVAEYILSDKCKKVAILAGAGISVSAGIPDFRSKTGFYKNYSTDDFPMLTKEQVKRLKNDPEHIFTINLFQENPSVYLHARKSFMLAKDEYSPTLTHWFFKLLEIKGLLKRFYSTNIDSLDVATDISSDILIHVHGTCGNAICYQCKQEYDMNKLRKLLKENAHEKEFIRCDKCNKNKNFIKPNTVLFGEGLPDKFWDLISKQQDLSDIDLLIIAGTSLSVSPSNMIPTYVDTNRCVRLLINREKIGWYFDFNNTTSNDVFYKGNCDDGITQLAKLCGYYNQLIQIKHNYDKKLKLNINKQELKQNDEPKLEELKQELTQNDKLADTLAAIDRMEQNFENIKAGFKDNIQQFATQFAVNALTEKPEVIDAMYQSVIFDQNNENAKNINDEKQMKSIYNCNIGDYIEYKYIGKYEYKIVDEWYEGNGRILNLFKDVNSGQDMIKIKNKYGYITFKSSEMKINVINEMEFIYGVSKAKPVRNRLPEKFFVYGTLRDDDDSNAFWTKSFVKDCIASNAKLYGFKIYKFDGCNYPFSIKTNDKNDCVCGRLLRWPDNGTDFFIQKLNVADEIEGYDDGNKDNFYEREIVNVETDNNQMVRAIVYYRTNVNLNEAIPIPYGDWLKRNLVTSNKILPYGDWLKRNRH